MLFDIINDENILITPNQVDYWFKSEPLENITNYLKKNILDKKEIINKWYDNNKFVSNTCGVNGKEIIDLTKRNSEKLDISFCIESKYLKKYCDEKNIISPYYTSLNDNYISTSPFELIKYSEGGFFLKHKDKLINSTPDLNHTHMCLLYPPMDFSEYEGGEIIFYDDVEKKKYIVETSLFENWTFIIFDRNILHEVKPVTKGIRYVLKAPLYTKNNASNNIEKDSKKLLFS